MRILLLCAFVVAANAFAPLKTARDPAPGRYIVKLKEGVSADVAIPSFKGRLAIQTENFQVLKTFKKVFNGFSVKMSERAVNLLRKSDMVEYIEEDGIVKANSIASWGLDRIDQIYLPLDDVYTPTGDGTGVHVYVIDTGINADHQDFNGRASSAYDAIGGTGNDCNGHGSHCAGTVAGTSYGVAKNVQVYGVRVLNCLGSGYTSDIVDACDWVAVNGNRPAIGSMSLGGGASSSMDAAVEAMINDGIQVAVAAGNDDADACSYSPARTTPAITVGATDSSDVRAYFSNYGTCVDIFAPGVSITSAWRGATDAVSTISGTSMACPHVAGAAAIVLAENPGMSPADIKTYLLDTSLPGLISDEGYGSPDLLLYVGGDNVTLPRPSGSPVTDPPATPGCGGFYNESGSSLTSPNYPSNYDNSASCNYQVQAPAGQVIRLSFSDFSLESHSSCSYDAVKVYDGSSSSDALLATLCGTSSPADIYSTGNTMYVSFTSDGSVTSTGFSATVTFGDTIVTDPPATNPPATNPPSTGCGGDFNVDGSSFTSPNYPSNYDNSQSCAYNVVAPAGKIVELSFSDFDVESQTTCNYDSVKVYDGATTGSSQLANLCGTELPLNVYSSGNTMLVQFTTDSSVTRGGFVATVRFLDEAPPPPKSCGDTWTEPTGTLTSPNYPDNYDNNAVCSYHIQGGAGQTVTLTFQTFDLESSSTCAWDYVEIYDGADDSATLLDKVCGSTIPGPYSSSGSDLYVYFSSDGSLNYGGFSASYSLS